MVLTCMLFPGLRSIKVCISQTGFSSQSRRSTSAKVSGFIPVVHSWRQEPIVWAETLNLEERE